MLIEKQAALVSRNLAALSLHSLVPKSLKDLKMLDVFTCGKLQSLCRVCAAAQDHLLLKSLKTALSPHPVRSALLAHKHRSE